MVVAVANSIFDKLVVVVVLYKEKKMFFRSLLKATVKKYMSSEMLLKLIFDCLMLSITHALETISSQALLMTIIIWIYHAMKSVIVTFNVGGNVFPAHLFSKLQYCDPFLY